MMQSIANGIKSLRRCNEITWDKPSALMNELVECVLAIGSRLTPNYGPRRIVDTTTFSEKRTEIKAHRHDRAEQEQLIISKSSTINLRRKILKAVPRHKFPVAFHITLLEIGSKSMEVLVIGKQSVSLSAVYIAVQHSQHRHNDWNLDDTNPFRNCWKCGNFALKLRVYVAVQRLIHEMRIRCMCSLEKLLEIVESNVNSNRKTNGGPQRVPSSNPLNQLQNRLNAKATETRTLTSQNSNMFVRSIPNCSALGTFVERATKCLATAPLSPAWNVS